MAATLTTKYKPIAPRATDSTGNIAHGKIFSGAGLHFDGVVDYLTSSGSIANQSASVGDVLGELSSFTMVYWVKFPSSITTNKQTSFYVGQSEFDDDQAYAMFGSDSANNEIVFSVNKVDGGSRMTSKASYTLPFGDGTDGWHRLVGVFDGPNDLLTLYVNSVVADTYTLSDNEDFAQGGNSIDFDIGSSPFVDVFIGGGTTEGGYVEQYVSDAQFWSEAWTLEDVKYDYLHPELSPPNLGKDSLRLWYPMNDSLEDQYIITDASKTGVGKDLLGDPTFSMPWHSVDEYNVDGVPYGWISGTPTATKNISKTSSGKLRLISTPANFLIYNSVDFRIRSSATNVMFKATVDIESIKEGSEFGFGVYETLTRSSITTPGIHEIIWHGIGSIPIMFVLDSAGDVVINSFSLQCINQKCNLGTIFYGDEEAVDGGFEAGLTAVDNTNDKWTDESVRGSMNLTMAHATDNPNSGSDSAKITLADTTGNIAYKRTDYVIGKSYTVEIYMKKNATGSNDNITAFQAFASTSFTGEDNGGTAITPSTSYQKVTTNFVATATSMFTHFKATGTSTHFGYVDDFSVKETGIATGWTTVDQQEKLPQLALQSYNEFLQFDDYDNKVFIEDTNNNNDNIFTGGGSISAWIFPTNAGAGTNAQIIAKGSAWAVLLDEQAAGNLSRLKITHNSSGDDLAVQSDTKIICGEWQHIVITWTKGDVGPIMYINSTSRGTTGTAGTATMVDDAAESITIGGTSGNHFNGCITEVSLWNTVLTQDQVTELYNNGKALDARKSSIFTEMTGYWRNDGVSTWIDLAASNNGRVSFGAQIIADGAFATAVAESTSGTHWITEAGWVISGGSATYDGGGDSNTQLESVTNSNLIDEVIHKVSFTLTDTGGGGVYVRICGGSFSLIEGTGKKTVYLMAGTSTNRLTFETGHDDKAFTIDDVSVYALGNTVANENANTFIISAGQDTDRDHQGFLMNRDKGTSSLNLTGTSYCEFSPADNIIGNGTDDFSYSFWFKFKKGTKGYFVGAHPMWSAFGVGIDSDAGDGKLRCRAFGESEVYSSSAFDDDEWHHAHYNLDRSASATLLVDKAIVITDNISALSAVPFTKDSWFIGAEIGISNFLNGQVDDLIFYNRLLTSPEITRNYNAGKRSHK